MPIALPPDTRTQLVASLKRYAAANLEEEIGDLKAGLLLDFCLAEIGAVVYNQAIADAQKILPRAHHRPRRRVPPAGVHLLASVSRQEALAAPSETHGRYKRRPVGPHWWTMPAGSDCSWPSSS